MRDPREALSDVVAIPVTPFAQGSVDEEGYRRLLTRLVDAGIRTVTPNGNTSEFYALGPAERERLLVVAAETVDGAADVVAGIGLDADTAVREGRIAQQSGATMVMVHQPVHPYISASGWIDYHRAIAGSLPDLGVVLYVRAPWVDGRMIRALADAEPNVIGVKYAVPDPVTFARVRAEADVERLIWVAGLAEPYAPSYFAHGATGFTSGLVSVNPHLSLDLLEALRGGDFASASSLTTRIARFEELRAADRSANNVSVIKEALHLLGLADRAVRAPSSTVDERTRAEIETILADWATDYDLVAPGRPNLARA